MRVALCRIVLWCLCFVVVPLRYLHAMHVLNALCSCVALYLCVVVLVRTRSRVALNNALRCAPLYCASSGWQQTTFYNSKYVHHSLYFLSPLFSFFGSIDISRKFLKTQFFSFFINNSAILHFIIDGTTS